MTPPDTPLAALPAASPPPLRATGRVRLPRVPRWRRRTVVMVLLSLLLHLALLAMLLFVHRRLREPAVAPSFQVLFQPPGTEVGKPQESKPTELPAPTTAPAPAPVPPPPTPAVPPMPTPTPILPRAAPPPPTVLPPRPVTPTPPRATPPTPAPPRPTQATPPPPSAPPVPRPPSVAPPPPLAQPAPSAEFVPAAPPPRPAPTPLAPTPQSATPPKPSTALPPPLPAPPVPSPPKPAPPQEPEVRLSIAPPEFAPPPVEPVPPMPAPRPAVPRRPPAFPLPMNTALGTGNTASHSHNQMRGTGAVDFSLGRAALNSNGAPARDTNAESGDIVVRGAHVGKDWQELLHEWWLQHGFYPDEAAKKGEDGNVSIHVRVDRYGHVQLVEMESSSGSQWLDMGAQAVFRGATLPPFPPSTPEPFADLDITIRYILIGR